MLEGGIERRFIPELSDKTKELIVGFFNITMDDELRSLSTKKAEQVESTEHDTMLQRICVKSDTDDNKSLDGTDYLEITIALL